MRWLRIRKGYTGVTLRNAKILQIKQITSLLNKKYSKISSKISAIADNISYFVLSLEKHTQMRHSGVAGCGKTACPVAKRGSVLATVLPIVRPHRRRSYWGLGNVAGTVFPQGFSGFGWSNPFFFFRSHAGVRNRDHSGQARVFSPYLPIKYWRMPTWMIST